MSWKYNAISPKKGRYLCIQISQSGEFVPFLDANLKDDEEAWMFKHPDDSYYAIHPYDEGDVVLIQSDTPKEYGHYMVKNSGLEGIWTDYYGKLEEGNIGWDLSVRKVVAYGKIPYIDTLLYDGAVALLKAKEEK